MKYPTLCSLLFVASLTGASAAVSLPPIFSDHMVLQRGVATPVWGTAEPGEEVTVTVAGQKASTKADDTGKWMVRLDLPQAINEPQVMTVQGVNRLEVADVLIGEVWLASGQSNMAFQLATESHAKEEIPASANPLLRQFMVERTPSDAPMESCKGRWTTATPATVGSWSAVGYYFGKMLQKDLQVPVAILHSSWGGTPSEAWTSAEAMDSTPATKKYKEGNLARYASYLENKTKFGADFAAWQKTSGREDRPTSDPAKFAGLDIATEDWKPITIPGSLSGQGMPEGGTVWLRGKVTVPTRLASSPLRFDLGVFDGFESVFWNGVRVTEITPINLPSSASERRANIPANLVKEGDNIVAIRLYAPGKMPNFDKSFSAGASAVSSDWLAREEFSLPALDAAQLAKIPKPPAEEVAAWRTATYLFNGMIAPIIPYGIRGSIWYQGEGNSGRAAQYRVALPQLINDWRSRWNEGNFPFYVCQLPNYLAKDQSPKESNWAELRESQAETCKLPNTAYAVLIDIGESNDIHPRNKKDAGERLALIALAKDYGRDVTFQGPTYESMSKEGDKIRIKFSGVSGGLVAKPVPAKYQVNSIRTADLVRNSPDSELEGFSICGADKNWVWANARIDGDSVVVSSPAVPDPMAVRYAWASNPTCNLYNGNGLPAAPFRTDDYPLVTARE